jgi:hypothetical protein
MTFITKQSTFQVAHCISHTLTVVIAQKSSGASHSKVQKQLFHWHYIAPKINSNACKKCNITHLVWNIQIWVSLLPTYCTSSNTDVTPTWFSHLLWPSSGSICHTEVIYRVTIYHCCWYMVKYKLYKLQSTTCHNRLMYIFYLQQCLYLYIHYVVHFSLYFNIYKLYSYILTLYITFFWHVLPEDSTKDGQNL